jgi:hypothetical protein
VVHEKLRLEKITANDIDNFSGIADDFTAKRFTR